MGDIVGNWWDFMSRGMATRSWRAIEADLHHTAHLASADYTGYLRMHYWHIDGRDGGGREREGRQAFTRTDGPSPMRLRNPTCTDIRRRRIARSFLWKDFAALLWGSLAELVGVARLVSPYRPGIVALWVGPWLRQLASLGIFSRPAESERGCRCRLFFTGLP